MSTSTDNQVGTPVGRRLFLGLVGLGAVGVVTGKAAQSGLSAAIAPIQSRDPSGLSGLLPLGNEFRYYSVTGSVVTKTASTYALAVTGLVDHPTQLRLPDLAAMPQTVLTRDFQCVTGWRVPAVHWSGVKLGDVLDHAGVQSGATAVRFTSFDGTYTESLTLDQARRDDVLVATSMLDAAVTHDHGGPVRLYVAPMYGYKSIKWLNGIELTKDVMPGYWENNGYDVDGWVGTSNGRGDDPTS